MLFFQRCEDFQNSFLWNSCKQLFLKRGGNESKDIYEDICDFSRKKILFSAFESKTFSHEMRSFIKALKHPLKVHNTRLKFA